MFSDESWNCEVTSNIDRGREWYVLSHLVRGSIGATILFEWDDERWDREDWLLWALESDWVSLDGAWSCSFDGPPIGCRGKIGQLQGSVGFPPFLKVADAESSSSETWCASVLRYKDRMYFSRYATSSSTTAISLISSSACWGKPGKTIRWNSSCCQVKISENEPPLGMGLSNEHHRHNGSDSLPSLASVVPRTGPAVALEDSESAGTRTRQHGQSHSRHFHDCFTIPNRSVYERRQTHMVGKLPWTHTSFVNVSLAVWSAYVMVIGSNFAVYQLSSKGQTSFKEWKSNTCRNFPRQIKLEKYLHYRYFETEKQKDWDIIEQWS